MVDPGCLSQTYFHQVSKATGALQRHEERGANAVEFALLVPILILLLFGIISFGWLFSQQLALNNAVREGARFAVTVGNPTAQQCNQLQPTVRNALAGSTIGNTDDVTVTARIAGSSDCTGTTILCQDSFDPVSGDIASIEVDAVYPANLLLPVPSVSPTLTLSARAVYRCEFS
jgi:Flp pilus assembly pilin Flp